MKMSMVKPGWHQAPEWANYLYPNAIGVWTWSSEAPRWSWWNNWWVSRGIHEGTMGYPRYSYSHKPALEKRP